MRFAWTSGRSSLDFVGTLRWRRGPESREYLERSSDLADWGLESGLLTDAMSVTSGQLVAARHLREAVYRVVLAATNGHVAGAADVAALNAAAERLPLRLRLQDDDGSVSRSGTVAQLLSTLARDALDLLGSDQIELVRECDGATCTRLYVDSSRARNRRWCSNSECGNQAKVAAFRRRAAT